MLGPQRGRGFYDPLSGMNRLFDQGLRAPASSRVGAPILFPSYGAPTREEVARQGGFVVILRSGVW